MKAMSLSFVCPAGWLLMLALANNAGAALPPIPADAVTPRVADLVRPFDLADVILGPGPFRDAMDRDAAYLLRLDPDSRRNRFAGAVSDEFVRDYAELSFGIDPLIHGFFVDGTLRGAAELRPIGAPLTREAEAALRQLREARNAHRRYVSAHAIGLVYTGLGNRDEAIGWLERARRELAWGVAFLGVEPDFDPLRDDARFGALIAR